MNEHDIEQPLAKVEHPLFLLIGKTPVLRVERSLAEGFLSLKVEKVENRAEEHAELAGLMKFVLPQDIRTSWATLGGSSPKRPGSQT